MTALLVLAILVLLVIVHELGHFVAAKWFGVRVEEFGIGYPPRALTIAKIGDTEYTINWLPFGGFVRLFGDEGDRQHRGPEAFVNASRGVQAIVLVAGVAMNILAGWVLYAGALHLGVPRAVSPGDPGAYLLVTGVVPGSPADAAGLAEGDRVVSVVDQRGEAPAELSPDGVADFVRMRGGKEITISYERAEVMYETIARPAQAIIPNDAGRAALGVGLSLASEEPLPLLSAFGAAAGSVAVAFTSIATELGALVVNAFHGGSRFGDVVGPVGLVKVVGDAAKSGLGNVLALAGLISVNLAVINLLPIPALDGGRLVILAIEAIRRKDAPRFIVQGLNAIGVVFILLLMAIVTYHDIARLLA